MTTPNPAAITLAERARALIAKVREYEAKATAGPWEWEAQDGSMLSLGTKGNVGLNHVLSAWRCRSCEERDAKCLWPSKGNGNFIENSRTDLPAAIDLIEELLNNIAPETLT